jgi:uncharacterized membrane protein YfhO
MLILTRQNNFTLEPILPSNLTYFDIPARDFVTNGVEQTCFDALDLMYLGMLFLKKI